MEFEKVRLQGKSCICYSKGGDYVLQSYDTPVLIYHVARNSFEVTLDFADWLYENDNKVSLTTSKHINNFFNYLKTGGYNLIDRKLKKPKESKGAFFIRMFETGTEF